MRSIVYAFALVMAFAIGLELSCRVDDFVRFGTSFVSPVESEGDLLVRDAEGEHGRPHTRYRQWAINNVGMRGPDIAPRKPAGVRRIVTAGASETFGLYESPG